VLVLPGCLGDCAPNWIPPLFSSQSTAIHGAAPRMGVERASRRDYSSNSGFEFRSRVKSLAVILIPGESLATGNLTDGPVTLLVNKESE
jgi:hypothetical protein